MIDNNTTGLTAIIAPITHVYVDMDGVLANFPKQALKACKCDELIGHYPQTPNKWEMHEELGYDNDDDFWNDIRDYPCFWETMEPYPYLKRLVGEIKRACNKAGALFSVASKPDKTIDGYAGKRAWYEKYLEHLGFEELILIGKKEKLAGVGKLLIDDKSSNCHKFYQHGGWAEIFPQPWNERWIERCTFNEDSEGKRTYNWFADSDKREFDIVRIVDMIEGHAPVHFIHPQHFIPSRSL